MDTKMVIDFLTKLGEQVSSTGQEVFKIYMQQAYVDGITSLIWAGVLFLIFIVGCGIVSFKLLRYAKKVSHEENYDEEEYTASLGIGIAVIVIGIVVFLLFGMPELTDGIKHLINPQYFAIQDLANVVKNAVSK